jgi:uncharacterized protein (TIGR02466 family)
MHPNEFSIFPVPLWGYILREEKYHALDYIDLLKRLEVEEPSAVKSNFGGYQTRDDMHKEGVMREFVGVIESLADGIAKHRNLPPLKVISMWGNINYRGNFNGAHTHEGILSGVFYLQVPENSGSLIICNPAVRAHNSPIRNNDYGIKPEKFACILFPSWLEHYVQPNLNTEPRISLSFNFDVR